MKDGFYDIPHRVATEFLLPRHYSGRKPNICFSYGSYVNGVLKAVCTFGIPASPTLCSGLAGKDNAKHVIELNRLCREDDYNKPLSHPFSGTYTLQSGQEFQDLFPEKFIAQ